jgi:hypothetical protein
MWNNLSVLLLLLFVVIQHILSGLGQLNSKNYCKYEIKNKAWWPCLNKYKQKCEYQSVCALSKELCDNFDKIDNPISEKLKNDILVCKNDLKNLKTKFCRNKHCNIGQTKHYCKCTEKKFHYKCGKYCTQNENLCKTIRFMKKTSNKTMSINNKCSNSSTTNAKNTTKKANLQSKLRNTIIK